MTEVCPQCGEDSLRVTNVMGSTCTIYRHCSICCYRDEQHYCGDDLIGEPRVTRKDQCKRAKDLHALLSLRETGRLSVPNVREKSRDLLVGKKVDGQMSLICED